MFESYSWLDDDTLIACLVPENHDLPPTRPGMPLGPKIQVRSVGGVEGVDVWWGVGVGNVPALGGACQDEPAPSDANVQLDWLQLLGTHPTLTAHGSPTRWLSACFIAQDNKTGKQSQAHILPS